MDIPQIERKLEEKQYKEVGEFEYDVNLVFDNCLAYHGKDSGQWTFLFQLRVEL